MNVNDSIHSDGMMRLEDAAFKSLNNPGHNNNGASYQVVSELVRYSS
jgi:hypothetical protein